LEAVRILYFHQHFSTPEGSAGTRSYEMARALVAAGHKVTMVCGSYGVGKTGLTVPFQGGKRRGLAHGIEVVEFELHYSNRQGFFRRTLAFLKYAFRSTCLAMTEPCDLVFATTTPLTAGIPGILARWLRGTRFVFEVRDLWPELPREMGVIKNPIVLTLMDWLEFISYRSAHRLIGLSPGIVAGITRRGVAEARVALIPNGCDLSLFGAKASPWRPEGVRATDLLAVYAGTHGVANGLDAVIDAAQVLKNRGRDDVKIVLVGDGKLKEALIARAAREHLDNVIFCPPVNKSRLSDLLASAGVGMQLLANVPAFYYGTSPNKFFDYLASGIPTLINYPGWLAKIVKDRQCGFAIPPDDVEAFADVLAYAADHRDTLEEMGKRGLELARTEFDRAMLAGRFVTWLQETPVK
jgi:glycosyltransferase involved in cell wall biosynthesis